MKKETFVVINIVFGALLVGWPFVSFGAIFFFDAPGSAQNPYVLNMAWSIWTYPVFYAIGLIGSIVAYKKRFPKAVSLPIAFTPLLSFIWFFGSASLLHYLCGGNFSCH